MSRRPRIGVFGGTFDPPHRGHVAVATEVANALSLDRVLWIPAWDPPHKPEHRLTEAAIRSEMVREATRADRRFEVCDVEIRRGGPSFTVDTLRALRDERPDASLFLILGADQVAAFATGWKDPDEIVRLATLAVVDREGTQAAAVAPNLVGSEGAVHVPIRRIDLSSTLVRRVVGEGGDVSPMVPKGVLAVIEREGLYRT